MISAWLVVTLNGTSCDKSWSRANQLQGALGDPARAESIDGSSSEDGLSTAATTQRASLSSSPPVIDLRVESSNGFSLEQLLGGWRSTHGMRTNGEVFGAQEDRRVPWSPVNGSSERMSGFGNALLELGTNDWPRSSPSNPPDNSDEPWAASAIPRSPSWRESSRLQRDEAAEADVVLAEAAAAPPFDDLPPYDRFDEPMETFYPGFSYLRPDIDSPLSPPRPHSPPPPPPQRRHVVTLSRPPILPQRTSSIIGSDATASAASVNGGERTTRRADRIEGVAAYYAREVDTRSTVTRPAAVRSGNAFSRPRRAPTGADGAVSGAGRAQRDRQARRELEEEREVIEVDSDSDTDEGLPRGTVNRRVVRTTLGTARRGGSAVAETQLRAGGSRGTTSGRSEFSRTFGDISRDVVADVSVRGHSTRPRLGTSSRATVVAPPVPPASRRRVSPAGRVRGFVSPSMQPTAARMIRGASVESQRGRDRVIITREAVGSERNAEVGLTDEELAMRLQMEEYEGMGVRVEGVEEIFGGVGRSLRPRRGSRGSRRGGGNGFLVNGRMNPPVDHLVHFADEDIGLEEPLGDFRPLRQSRHHNIVIDPDMVHALHEMGIFDVADILGPQLPFPGMPGRQFGNGGGMGVAFNIANYLPDDAIEGADYETLLALGERVGEVKQRGLDERSVAGLPTKKYRAVAPTGQGSDGSDESRCTVCLEDFVDGEELAVLPCLHSYHGDCVKNWLRGNGVCPM
ncbi:hypothetical protein HDU93_000822 [Gonapodya sp. JEL0774]|nr:hypothetical protein HDU93_000822 [Gonapodya sp. JEL0774]